MQYNIKEHVKGNATFQYYRDSALWYQTEAGLTFPVPTSDIGTTTFNGVEKGMMMMRWIRKHIEMLQAESQALSS